jgi:hypothetical protein
MQTFKLVFFPKLPSHNIEQNDSQLRKIQVHHKSLGVTFTHTHNDENRQFFVTHDNGESRHVMILWL